MPDTLDQDPTPDSILAVQVHVPHLYLYVITAAAGGSRTIDPEHETNYLICNGYEEALDLMDSLPEIDGGYALHSCEVDTNLAWFGFVSSRD